MRNELLLDSVDASVQQISEPVNLERRTDWELTVESNGLDGTPNLFIEKGFNRGDCHPLPTEWFPLANKCDNSGAFLIDDDLVQIEKTGFTANWFRVRLEPNGNTTGNVKATFHYKDYT